MTDVKPRERAAKAESSMHPMWDGTGGGVQERDPNAAGCTGLVNFNHVPAGSNVLYMDGHVEFINYPGKFPITTFAAPIYGYAWSGMVPGKDYKLTP